MSDIVPADMQGDRREEDPVVTRDTILVRTREVLVRLTNEDEIGVDLGGERFVVPRIGLAILDGFASPRSVSEVLESVALRDSEQALEGFACIEHLVERGALVRPDALPAPTTRGWVKPAIHLSMLDDRARTSGFCHALRSMVGPDDVVLDIGTGTGVLATCAALAGARQVYAVESSGIAEVAERMFVANGVADRVKLLRERSTSITLPERATVLVTETIGNDPLDEQILELVADAKSRLLAPGARIIPAGIDIYAIAVDIPRTVFERHVFTQRKVDGYREAYGMSFDPLVGHRLSTAEPIMLDSRDVATWPLAQPVLLASIDFAAPYEQVVTRTAHVEISRDAQYLGIMLAFSATLCPGTVLSNLPADFDHLSHWAHALFPAFDCLSLPKSTRVAIDYMYDRAVTSVRVTKDAP